MTLPKKYRTDWTIEEIDAPYAEIRWYKHQIDMDNVHYCSTVEEAESEIDDAIIMEQEQVIERLIDALRESTIMLTNALYANDLFNNAWLDLLRHQITENDRLIKAFQL